ncbi:MAG TPA: SIR2 family protein, partial [Acidobacteriota bacterium]|nr:SIR2 family protein [Acidobacteriota bacterium]
RRRWNPSSFDYDVGSATGHPQTPRFQPSARHIRLYKLHGSLSWLEDDGVFYEEPSKSVLEKMPLIIYPSRLKYAQSIRPPFDWLFRTFSGALDKARLLICIGYSFADEDLNQCIFPCLKNHLSLLALSREPISALASVRAHRRVSAINEAETIIGGKDQNQTTDLWAFERFAEWLPAP